TMLVRVIIFRCSTASTALTHRTALRECALLRILSEFRIPENGRGLRSLIMANNMPKDINSICSIHSIAELAYGSSKKLTRATRGRC
ncbi:hypothetical protein PMAYCL1PPCAC_10973, partial [Pristionchus mayeri]